MACTPAIEKHRQALKRIVAGLVAMVADAGLVLSGRGDATLPRHLHRAVLRLLRPAESAARRLVIALARELPASSLPLPRPRTASAHRVQPGAPNPGACAARPLSFPLLDPLTDPWRRQGRRRPVATSVPRICVPGVTERFAIPAWRPPLRDEPVDAGRLGGRLTALARVLDDLPGQAKRFARWKARRDQALGAGRMHRVAPLRIGRPPGGRLSRYDPCAAHPRNIRDVDEILAHAHALAYDALRPDTS